MLAAQRSAEWGIARMQNGNQHVRERQRLDFAKIQSSIQIPNLIEVQKKSYQRFLQMDLLPSEREDSGLQSVFTSVFPIRDFREMSQLDFVDYSIGNWECKCGNLKGLHHLRATCRNCGASVVTNPYQTGDVICQKCGTFNKNTPTFCNKCGDPVAMQLKYDVNECQERGMTYSALLAFVHVVFELHRHRVARSEEHTSELQSRLHLVCRL